MGRKATTETAKIERLKNQIASAIAEKAFLFGMENSDVSVSVEPKNRCIIELTKGNASMKFNAHFHWMTLDYIRKSETPVDLNRAINKFKAKKPKPEKLLYLGFYRNMAFDEPFKVQQIPESQFYDEMNTGIVVMDKNGKIECYARILKRKPYTKKTRKAA